MTKRNKTILIIESDLSLRSVLCMAMHLEGHKVIEAETEEMAQEIIKNSSNTIHCILNSIAARSDNFKQAAVFNIPVIAPPAGLLNLHDLHRAISAINQVA